MLHSMEDSKKESCKAGFSACGGSRKRHSTIPPQCDPRGAFIIVWKRSFLYDNKKKGHAVHPEMKSMSFFLFKEIYFKEIYFFAPCFATAFILASIAAWSPR